MTYHAKMIAGGKLVIPAELRRALDIKDGDRVMLEQRDGAIFIRTQREALRRLQDLVQAKSPSEIDPIDIFIADRRAGTTRDDALDRR